MEIQLWESSPGKSPVAEFLQSLDKKTRAKVSWILDLVEKHGMTLLGKTPYFQKLSGYDLYEVRVKFNKQIYRMLGVVKHSKLWLVHAFNKKDQKTRLNDIALAMVRAKNIKG